MAYPHGLAPFPGNRPFSARERALYFGRAPEVRELAEFWHRCRVTILHGESGTGKTSLLRAGAIPALRDAGHPVLPPALPGHRLTLPMAAVPGQNPFGFAVLCSWQPETAPTRVAGRSLAGFLAGLSRPDRFGAPAAVHLAVDQAEGLFAAASADEAARVAFLDEFAEALADRADLRLLLVVRDDHLPEALEFARRLDEPGRMALGPLDRAAAAEAVRGPLGPGAPTGLPGRLAAELCDARRDSPGGLVEPALLQAVCLRLLGDGREPPDEPGPAVARALTSHVAGTLARVAAAHRLTPEELTGWFRDVFAPRAGGARVVYEESPKTAGMPTAVLADLVDRHLLRAHRHRDGSRFYRLAHPRLVKPVRTARPAEAVRLTPQERLEEAHRALRRGDHAQARAHADTARAYEGPDALRVHADAETLLGNIAYLVRHAEAAIAHYREAALASEALGDTTTVGRLLAAIGRLHLGAGESPARAVADLHAAADRVPHDPAIQTGLGRALWLAGRPTSALAVLSGVLALDGETTEALGTRGEILADLGDPASAASALRDLDRLPRPRASARAARALALAVLDRGGEARAALETAAPDTCDSSLVLLRAARVEDLTGHPAAAARLAARATQATDPPLPDHLRATADRLRGDV
ncbi:tetratricopeptide repeat protein [Actinocorallia sp. API 0066]|uniref:nSTAND1 domain-containing NTPase n=1 Tax=Actinocorallia sp. API 0066 TaxID=2896846 RepID=UPI001E3EF3AE|nr:tetratricopeptide repeat protein [Actinocorallia sp. API 0066]MCD0452581.1 tetratricopeptide repeat protein [Actinocorallia sp. API 0066]